MLKNLKDGGSPKEKDRQEEDYQEMFPKIARDFVYREDLIEMMSFIIDTIGILESNAPSLNKEAAKQKALEYKKNLSLPRNKRKKYKDVNDE